MALLVSIRSSISSLILVISLATATVFPAHAAQTPPAMFVFGDSLSDVGNNNALPDGFHANFAHYGVDFPGGVATGRFTNGYNFIDVIAQHLGFEQSPPAFVSVSRGDNPVSKGVNFASGGSGIMVECMDGTAKKCITMDEQIDNFKRVRTLLEQQLGSKDMTNKLVSNSLFVFTCGGNDLNNFFDKHSFLFPFAPIDEYVANLTSAFNSQLRELYEFGGRKFAVINVPAIGRIPTARALDVLNIIGINFERVLNGYARKFNKAEAAMLRGLSSTLPEMKYSIGNAYSVIMDVTNNPKKYGMKNAVDPCCGNVQFVVALHPVKITYCSPTAWLCSNHSEYVFWDHIHPTQPVNEYAGELFYSGVPPYATPINLKQLVGDDQTAPRRGVSLRGVGSFEAM